MLEYKSLGDWDSDDNKFTAQDIYDRGSAIGDRSVLSTYVDVTNITTTDIRNQSAGGSNAIGDLSISDNVNRWSWYSPAENNSAADTITRVVNTPYPAGLFAGYDHNARKPRPVDFLLDGFTDINEGDVIEKQVCCDAAWSADLKCNIGLGQLKYDIASSSNVGARFVIKKVSDDSTVVISDVQDITAFSKSSDKHEMVADNTRNLSITNSDVPVGTTELYAQIQIVNTTEIPALVLYQFDSDDSFKFSIYNHVTSPNVNDSIMEDNFPTDRSLEDGYGTSINCDTVYANTLKVVDGNGYAHALTVDISGSFDGKTWEVLDQDVTIPEGGLSNWSADYSTTPECGDLNIYALKFTALS